MYWHFRYQILYHGDIVAYEIVVVNVPSGDDAAHRAEGCLRTRFPGMTIERVIVGEVDHVVFGEPRVEFDFSDVDFNTMTNRQIAELKGTSVSKVEKYRLEMAIPSPERRGRPRGALPPTLEKIMAAGKVGNESDTSLANEFGVSPQLIRQYRYEFGIPPVRVPLLTAEDRANFEAKLEAIHGSGMLGRISDLEIARRFGITGAQVGELRKRHGIPSRRGRPAGR